MKVTDQLHDPDALPPGNEPLYPLDRRLGGPHSRSGRGGDEMPLTGIEPTKLTGNAIYSKKKFVN